MMKPPGSGAPHAPNAVETAGRPGGILRRLKCWLGAHESVMDNHHYTYSLWDDVRSECIHCHKRKEWRCHRDTHWEERHDERIGQLFRWYA